MFNCKHQYKTQWARLSLKTALLLCGLFILSFLQATERFEVSHAQTTVIDGQYFLSADITYSLHAEAREILERGLPINIELQVELYEQRKYWRNKTIASISKNYFLQRNALTERFVITIPDGNSLQSFATAQEAVLSLRYLDGIPLIEETKISDPKKIQARARMIVDVRHFSEPLQYLAKYWDDWRIVSAWYVWPLKL